MAAKHANASKVKPAASTSAAGSDSRSIANASTNGAMACMISEGPAIRPMTRQCSGMAGVTRVSGGTGAKGSFGPGPSALAVNLSDLAACGAQPLACTLALALRSIADVNEKTDETRDNAPKRGESIRVVRFGIPSSQTTQK